MRKTAKLNDVPEGVLGEIVSIENEGIFHSIGAHVGMSVVVLKKAMNSIIEIGYNQIEVSNDLASGIMVSYEM